MVTTNSPSPSPEPQQVAEPRTTEVAASPNFFGQLIGSIFEPGANTAVVKAMNISFALLLLTLFGLMILSSWNLHVVALFVINAALWATMMWFVQEISKVQTNPENMPTGDPLLAQPETKKEI
ncbi:SMK killer toxin resistance protein [Apiotrichum porosum]|uniref:SMK killer toxin resistance protein n=1 Tax=Apiotrichum porosum TaxID=105984 RepID=A0A427XQ79_9TREE|nr:SMK killer toxin resistance protein [Apiotrichum porosum]RSH81002.1 SMK killer toxin resistance protein [Apiotrichum porosum]